MIKLGTAKINAAGKAVPLDRRPPPSTQVTQDDVADPRRLAVILTRAMTKAAERDGRWDPRRIDFEDLTCTSANVLSLRHNFNGRVRWWIVDWTSPGTPLVDSVGNTLTVYAPMLVKATATDENVLVLQSYVAGTATIRVEEAG